MFEALSERLEDTFRRLRGRGRLSERDVDEVLREVRLALLEADVATSVVRAFLERVRARATGAEVRKALTPAQQVIRIVHEELTGILGRAHAPLRYASKPPTVVMLAGLQGSGKTTAAAKLARFARSKGKRPLLVACDLRRPAAIEQLLILGAEIDVPIVTRTGVSAVDVAAAGLEEAARAGRDVVIVDTAGRLHIDSQMMAEAAAIRDRISPHETLLVVDSMTGQDAVNVATAFLERIDYSGIVLTKVDGDARGGAALSIAHISGRPVKFASTGERLDAFEPFHPERLASRILGMGDVLTLIEKAEEAFADRERTRMEEKLRRSSFTLEDFLGQMRQIRTMGPLTLLLGMIPGMKTSPPEVELDEKDLRRVEAIIQSMTPAERRDTSIIDASRRQRIARGCGRRVADVNALVRQFDEAKVMMRALAGGGGLPSLPRGMMPAGARTVGRSKHKPRSHRPKQHAHRKRKRR